MPDISEEDMAEQQRLYRAHEVNRNFLNQTQNQQQYGDLGVQIAAGVRGNAQFPGETAGESSAAGAASGANATAMGKGKTRPQKRVQFDLVGDNLDNPIAIDADGDVAMVVDDDDAASIASGGSIPEGDPRKMLDLQPKRSKETTMEYRYRIKEAKEKLYIQSKPGFDSAAAKKAQLAREDLQYERERNEEEHAIKLSPESGGFDKDYAADWRRQKQVRQENNRVVKEKLFSEIREWEALACHNAPRIKTPEPNQDSGDELYD